MKSLHLLYHELRAVPSSYSYAMECAHFAQHCGMFSKKREKGELIPEVTFDDGHRSNYEFALPILERCGMRARFFVTVGWIGTRAGYMSWDEVRALARSGQTIGAHGWSHKLLTHCTAAQLEQELAAARKRLEDELGSAVTTMSLPGGRSNGRVLRTCWDAGYTEVFTSMPRAEPLIRAPGSTVGRLNIRGSITAAWIERVLQPNSGVLRKLEQQEKIKGAARNLFGDVLYAKLWSAINRQESNVDAAGAMPE
jgi:peptidoglycan/xylan/chitin deacetylase (PgdA/CDA1 family)